jgi:transcriptional antiterminator NusG
MSEVNRMLGKVDELAVNTDTRSIPFNIGETIKVDGPLMVSMVQLKNRRKA